MGYVGMKINEDNGHEKLGFPGFMSTPVYYLANPEDRLVLLDKAYRFGVATYALEVDPIWIYTYDYAPDQSWTVYNQDMKDKSQDNYIFTQQAYFRICIQKADGSDFSGNEDINDIILYESQPSVPCEAKPWIKNEAKRISDLITELRTKDDIVFAVITDSHYVINGTWQDTIDSVRLVSKAANLDGIIHLGDMTDGMVTKDATRYYAQKVMSDLKSCGASAVYPTIGNHDTNYFRKNKQLLSNEEQRELYLSDIPGLNDNETRYFVDFPRLRLIFLDSFDPDDKLRYGYSLGCTEWLRQTLSSLGSKQKAIIFSHLPPITRLQFWAKALRGEKELINVLHDYKDRILAWVNGHNHADHIDNEEGFPIISVANAKCECFLEHKPEGFISPKRILGDVSQELWDILLVNAKKGSLRFIRFGSGKDKMVADGKVAWL